jgi:hypothetical protein
MTVNPSTYERIADREIEEISQRQAAEYQDWHKSRGRDGPESYPVADQQASYKQLQTFSLALLPLEELDAYASLVRAAYHCGVNRYGLNVGRNL